ncbi:MAG: homocysteine S-methyltransferase family protein [Planctomycetota bacterium]|nr:homocysteine S-methyltransferase family protein [Planctomycetota bacterium]
MHPVRQGFEAMLADAPLLLSGAVGTELLRRGVATPLPLWATAAMLEAPEVVRSIHADYVSAGARIVTANTFRTDRTTLSKVGLATRTRELNKLAVRLAREGVAAARPTAPILVAGSVAPVEDCYEPDLVPDDRTLTLEHGVRIGHLVAAGAACALIETMNTIREARVALEAANAGNLPAFVSFTCAPGARLLSGEPVAEAVAAVEPLAPLGILVNCCAPDVATEALAQVVEATAIPAGVYANGRGRAHDETGWVFKGGVSNRAYVKEARRWLDLGARLIGGCCGTTPRTIRALARLLAKR